MAPRDVTSDDRWLEIWRNFSPRDLQANQDEGELTLACHKQVTSLKTVTFTNYAACAACMLRPAETLALAGCVICHKDIHLAAGIWRWRPALPASTTGQGICHRMCRSDSTDSHTLLEAQQPQAGCV
ncbi:hypothetical protein PGT21_034734 [Puccinia graminis f. sp. tritici]|uniref:Uncharacterized protein n=1 Tax=Puccinia graminis f. sp. tritici TaxID=56615 RepID=A0A5B0MRF9_PUCGR|nr:hypothetical protein PGT21_034734 [Puccinia graminis f. sp. tritici]